MEEHLLAVQRMQDWIADNPGREITLSELSRASLFSPWYSHRLFRQELGLTPAEYVRKLRLSMAAVRLRDGNERILDIADEIVVLDQGGIRSRGTKQEIMPELLRSADVARSCSRIEEGGL